MEETLDWGSAHPAELSVCHFALARLNVRSASCPSVWTVSWPASGPSPAHLLAASCLPPARLLPARRLCFSCQTNFVARLAGVVLICCSFALFASPPPRSLLPPPVCLSGLGLSSLAQFEQILIYGYKAANGNGNLRRLLSCLTKLKICLPRPLTLLPAPYLSISLFLSLSPCVRLFLSFFCAHIH